MTQTLRLAFLGCGAISKFHLLGIRDGAPQIQVTAAIDLDQDVVEQLQAARKALHAASRALGDHGEAPVFGHQQVQNAVRLTEIDGAQNERLGIQR